MLARLFQPSRLGVALLLGILLIQVTALWQKQTLMAMRSDGCFAYITHRIGRPVMAEIHIDEQPDRSKVRTMQFFPRNAILIIVGAYAVAMPLATWLTERRAAARARGFAVIPKTLGDEPAD